jgi:hypothetical protein
MVFKFNDSREEWKEQREAGHVLHPTATIFILTAFSFAGINSSYSRSIK